MEELDPSVLGTKSYWEEAYKKEIVNFDDHGDTGDVWFGEDSADRVINWICDQDFDKSSSVIDLGCGNGYTLIELAKEGFTDLLGVDYCSLAIELAKKVSVDKYPDIKYKVFDITKDSITDLNKKFKIVHDKGTYDAISLNPDSPGKHRAMYIERVYDMLDDGGIFVITSCNWTDAELIKQFNEKLKLKQVLPTPQFKFGGKVGSMVSSVVFEKDK